MITETEALAKFIADVLDGDFHDGLGVWVSAHVDSDPGSVWVELTDAETDGAAGQTFLVTIERQP